MRILIIEDEDRLRRMMRLTLEESCEVGEAPSGEAGLERFRDEPPWDAVLLDQRLPGIDGLETLRRLKQRDPGACVVMVTAFASIELAVDAMKLGAADFLRKPVSAESLRGAVAAALHARPERDRERLAAAPAGAGRPNIVHVTMNGFQIVREGEDASQGPPHEHRFSVMQFASGERRPVTVSIDPEEIARVNRLARRHLKPQGTFWRAQAERCLAGHLWIEGRLPNGGLLALTGLPREAIELATAWEND